MQVKDTITIQIKKDCRNSLTLTKHSLIQTLVVNLPPRKCQNSQENPPSTSAHQNFSQNPKGGRKFQTSPRVSERSLSK
jgi:hypothetical protein